MLPRLTTTPTSLRHHAARFWPLAVAVAAAAFVGSSRTHPAGTWANRFELYWAPFDLLKRHLAVWAHGGSGRRAGTSGLRPWGSSPCSAASVSDRSRRTGVAGGARDERRHRRGGRPASLPATDRTRALARGVPVRVRTVRRGVPGADEPVRRPCVRAVVPLRLRPRRDRRPTVALGSALRAARVRPGEHELPSAHLRRAADRACRRVPRVRGAHRHVGTHRKLGAARGRPHAGGVRGRAGDRARQQRDQRGEPAAHRDRARDQPHVVLVGVVARARVLGGVLGIRAARSCRSSRASSGGRSCSRRSSSPSRPPRRCGARGGVRDSSTPQCWHSDSW